VTTTASMMSEGGARWKMSSEWHVVRVATVLDESDEGRSGVNNNVHYDGADGHQGGTLTTIIMDEEIMVWETLPPPFVLQVFVVFGGCQETVSTLG
jgi:hypothetical protein